MTGYFLLYAVFMKLFEGFVYPCLTLAVSDCLSVAKFLFFDYIYYFFFLLSYANLYIYVYNLLSLVEEMVLELFILLEGEGEEVASEREFKIVCFLVGFFESPMSISF